MDCTSSVTERNGEHYGILRPPAREQFEMYVCGSEMVFLFVVSVQVSGATGRDKGRKQADLYQRFLRICQSLGRCGDVAQRFNRREECGDRLVDFHVCMSCVGG